MVGPPLDTDGTRRPSACPSVLLLERLPWLRLALSPTEGVLCW